MSPTHKVRRVFLFTCCVTVVLFVGLSWRFLSNRDVRHFSQANNNYNDIEAHVPYKLNPTLKIYAQALKHLPLQRELPEPGNQAPEQAQDRGTDDADSAHEAEDFELVEAHDPPHTQTSTSQQARTERTNHNAPATVDRVSENASVDIDEATNSKESEHFENRQQISAKDVPKAVKETEQQVEVEDKTTSTEDAGDSKAATEVKAPAGSDNPASSQSHREGTHDAHSQGETTLVEENDASDNQVIRDDGWNNAVGSNMIPDEDLEQTKVDASSYRGDVRLAQTENQNSVSVDSKVQEVSNHVAHNNEIQFKSNHNNEHNNDDVQRNVKQQQDLHVRFDSNTRQQTRLGEQRKALGSVPRSSSNHDNRYPNFGRLVKGGRQNVMKTKNSRPMSVNSNPMTGNSRPMGSVQNRQELLRNVSAQNERFRQMIEQMEKMKQARAERQRSLKVKIDFPVKDHTNDILRSNSRPAPKQELAAKSRDPGTGLDKFGERKDICAHCFHSNFPVLIDHPSYCHDLSPTTIVLLLISSAPMNGEKRQAIRHTWGAKCQDPASTHRCLFVLGDSQSTEVNDKLRKENEEFKDILQFGFKDAYSNLTYKTLTSLHWVSRQCGEVSYVMKTDDDMWVNTELIPALLTATPRKDFMGGFCWGNSSPNRDTQSKWYVPLRSFRHPSFPPMCSGTGYIMSGDVARKVVAASEDIPFFHLEDVYVALCLQKYDIRPRRIQGFNNVYVNFDPCQYRHKVMTSHQVPTYMLEQYWKQAQQCPGTPPSGAQLFVELSYPPT
ncbi:uncharacterized protein [Littorina saxatilis]|uniref:uncharacterized protein n=1 Tax=Littorina saxatilis TaxID=31220 RepID=UPI0038B583DB